MVARKRIPFYSYQGLVLIHGLWVTVHDPFYKTQETKKYPQEVADRNQQ